MSEGVAMSVTKPARWAVSPGMVDPKWRSLWRGLDVVMPFWDDAFTFWRAGEWVTPTNNGSVSLTQSPMGLAAWFNETDQWLATPSGGAWSVPANTECTIAVVYFIDDPTAGSSYQYVFSSGDYLAAGSCNLWFQEGGGAASFHGGADNTELISGAGVEDTSFPVTHILYRSSADNLHLWINGVQEDSGGETAAFLTGATEINIGRRTDASASRYFGGWLGAIYKWNRALSNEGEIQAFHQDPFGLIRPAWWGAELSVGATVTLYATADGTRVSIVNELNTTTNLYQSVDDDPSTPSDSDWINNLGGASGSMFFALTDVPAAFDTMDAVTGVFRWRATTHSNAVTLYAQLFQSDESTSLSDEVQVAVTSVDSSFTNTGTVTFTSVTAGSKAVWNGAKIRLRWA